MKDFMDLKKEVVLDMKQLGDGGKMLLRHNYMETNF